MRARLYKSTAHTLPHAPLEGPPDASPTLGVFNSEGTAVVAAGTSATRGSISTALNMASGVAAGERSIVVDDVSDVTVDHPFWVGNADTGTQEKVRAREVTASTNTIELVEPLRYSHDDNESVLDGLITYGLDTSDTATIGSYRVEWSYAVNSVSYVATRYFDVVARRFQLQIGEPDLAVYIPREVRESHRDAFNIAEVIRASEDMVLRWLREQGYAQPDQVMDVDQFDYLGILGVKQILLDRIVTAGDVGYEMSLARAESQWRQEADRILVTGVRLLDEDNDLIEGETEGNVQRKGRGPRRILGTLGV